MRRRTAAATTEETEPPRERASAAVIVTMPPAVVSTTPARVAAVLEVLRAHHADPAPDGLLVSALRDVAGTAKSWPAYTHELLDALTPLLTAADARTASLASAGCLELLDVAAALPEPLVEEILPSLSALLELGIGAWSWQLSLYRFARFPSLRARIVEAALAFAAAPRDTSNAATATMELEDVVIGLQRANALDEPRMLEAFAAFVVRQSNDDVRRAMVAYLLGAAPQILAPALAAHPELFPSIEALHALDAEPRVPEAAPRVVTSDRRAKGLAAAAPLALVEAALADRAHLGRRMAAAVAAPAAARAHPEARERLTALVRALLDDDREHHANVERQRETFGTSTVATAPFLELAQALPDDLRRAVALDALKSAARGPRIAFALVPIARLCDVQDAALTLTKVVADTSSSPIVRFAAVDALCTLSTPELGLVAHEACAALAEVVRASDEASAARLIEVALEAVPALAARHRQEDVAPLVDAWASCALRRTDVAPSLRIASFHAVRAIAPRAPWLDGPLDLARATLHAASGRDPSLALALVELVL